MSSGAARPGRSGRPPPLYDQVPVESLHLRPLSRPAQSADPLPPPPLPHQPPVGPEFHPSGSEEEQEEEEQEEQGPLDIKPVHRFIPDSWKNLFRGSGRSRPWSMSSSCSNNYKQQQQSSSSSGGVRCSPPHSPPSPRPPHGGSSSCNSRKELLGPDGSASGRSLQTGRSLRTGRSYEERVDQYRQRYGFMRSWAGLLRVLGCVELLLGAAVFACVCAYIHKDNEWFNMFGYSSPGGGAYGAGGYYGGGAAGGGAYYSGPKTPFVLVVAGLAWVVTVMLLVLGMTMYYRSILLDSSWWPLTEFTCNLALGLLYLAAAIVYVRDTTRGGLCTYPVFNNGINGVFCRTEAGQTAAMVFLFVTMLVYLLGALVCLKLWRHEAARLHRERHGAPMFEAEHRAARSLVVVDSAPPSKGREVFQDSSVAPPHAAPKAPPPKVLQGAIPSGHIPRPLILPDYIAKYQSIRSDEERDQYRAVFNDQYSEYKELHAEVQSTLRRFEEMDAMMRRLPPQPSSQAELDRINRILQEYQRKKNDPSFLEKKERCDYLKSKLAHIKQKIQEYDKVMEWNDGYS